MALSVPSTKQALLDLANNNNDRHVVLDNVVLGAPQPDRTQSRTNTKVTMTPLVGNGMFGTQDLYYNRLTQAEAFGGDVYVTRGDIEVDGATDEQIIQAALLDVSIAWSLPLARPGELSDIRYVANPNGGRLAGTVYANADVNYVMRGPIVINILRKVRSLISTVVETDLNAFTEEDVTRV